MTDRVGRQQGTMSDYVARNARALRRHAVAATVAGFDPNEDPVIIGSGANAGSGTPSSPSGGISGGVAIGLRSGLDTATSGVAIGKDANVGGLDGVAIGIGAATFNAGCVVIGSATGASGLNSVAIGQSASNSGEGTISIGKSATGDASISGQQTYGIAIGQDSVSTYLSVAIGKGASARFASGIAIGNGALTHPSSTFGDDAIAIGHLAQCGASGQSGIRGVAIGYGTAAHQEAVAIGYSAQGVGLESTAVGRFAQATNDNTTAVGEGSLADQPSASAFGTNAYGHHDSSTAVGYNATTTKVSQVMLGATSATVTMPGAVEMTNLPTSDPGVSGQLWSNSGVVTVSP